MSCMELWRRGETKQLKDVYQELETADDRMLDGVKCDYITYVTHWNVVEDRPLGFYRHKSAEATVKFQKGDRQDWYLVMLKTNTISDGKELLALIVGGKIQPVVCASNKQSSAAACSLRQLWGIIQRGINRFHTINQGV